ncbi:protein phosphatase 2C domain-containing protein [Arcanobacterium bovis]|uniref:Serine/threonine-protein phosphatase n=1 Tax=Arcanobacterium bovis TaxID=2529275 RepID=A0A4Q9UZ74_9ACTO|nr:protein phosphatase 2C domain-containing protein [Arcanobacterium bovis]TBW21048.1 serine/threonine-protein phosphatase [Arcanobacterium bovis]
MTIQLRYSAFSDTGLVRKNNQDSGYASPNLLVLADGMGGAAAGDVASSVTVAHLAQIDDVHPIDDLLPTLRRALAGAHDELIQRATEDPQLAGLGTTCISLLRSNNKLAMVHIGDSRAYLLRDGVLTQVTRDHTLVQYLVDHGEITPEQAENHPKRNVIMRALGDNPGDLEFDESVREAVPGDRWLLCSDGLFGVVSKETITQTLIECANIDECGQQLVELALAGGAPDNVTVVLADVYATADVEDLRECDRGAIVVGAAANKPATTNKLMTHPTRADGKMSAAEQAAQLIPPAEDAEDPIEEPSRRRTPLARLAVVMGIFAVIGIALTAAYAWTQSQYYVAPAGENIGIYKGIPQDIGPISLHSLEERTDVRIKDLTEVVQHRLETPITRSSLSEARELVATLSEQRATTELTPITPANPLNPNGTSQVTPTQPGLTSVNPSAPSTNQPAPGTQSTAPGTSPSTSGTTQSPASPSTGGTGGK